MVEALLTLKVCVSRKYQPSPTRVYDCSREQAMVALDQHVVHDCCPPSGITHCSYVRGISPKGPNMLSNPLKGKLLVCKTPVSESGISVVSSRVTNVVWIRIELESELT